MSERTFDAVSLGIMWDRLISIVDEIVSTLVRTSFSTIVNESYDLTCVVLDTEANSIAQGTFSVPVFIGSAPITLRHMLKRYPPETLKPGDVIMTNDPWQGTGHLYDITMVRPVFRKGRIVAYTLSITHLPDIGGSGFGSSAVEVYHEGIRIPICKLYEEGRLNELLIEIIRTNVRVPEQVIGDVMANVACNEVGGREMLAFMDEYGLDDLTDAVARDPRPVGGGDARQDPRARRRHVSATACRSRASTDPATTSCASTSRATASPTISRAPRDACAPPSTCPSATPTRWRCTPSSRCCCRTSPTTPARSRRSRCSPRRAASSMRSRRSRPAGAMPWGIS